MLRSKPSGGGVHAPERLYFMGEQEDPEADGWLARGLHVYGVNRGSPEDAPLPEHPPVVREPSPLAGLWVLNAGQWVHCGCGKCFSGPCPVPRE